MSTHPESRFADSVATPRPARDHAHSPSGLRARRIGRLLVLTDIAALLLVLLPAVLLAGLLTGTDTPPLTERPLVLLVPLAALPFLAAYRLYKNDRRRITVSALDELPSIFHALVLCGLLGTFYVVGADLRDRILSPAEIAAVVTLALVALPMTRSLVRRRHHAAPSVARQRTLIVGGGEVGQTVARKIAAHPELNLEVVGFADAGDQRISADLGHLPILGDESQIVELVGAHGIERIIMCFSRTPHEDVLEILRHADLDGVYISVVPRFFEITASSMRLDDVAGVPVLDMQPARLSRGSRAAKRAFDLGLTCVAIPLLMPVMAVIAIAIKLDSPGPIFFRQPRMGRDGSTFKIIKFRTMVTEAEARRGELLHLNQVTGPLFKLKEDPRVTRVGRFLRKTSLDELPQLFNVVRGEMSLVGPRPFVTYEAKEIEGWAARRLDLTPGITGPWQVMGRNDMPFDEMVKLDYLYVTNWSLSWDIRLLLRTIPSVLRRRGAY